MQGRQGGKHSWLPGKPGSRLALLCFCFFLKYLHSFNNYSKENGTFWYNKCNENVCLYSLPAESSLKFH